MGKVDWVDYLQRLLGLLAVVLGLGGGPVGFLLGRRQRAAEAGKVEAEGGAALATARKIDAETLVLVRGVYREMVGDLEAKVERMEGEQVRLRSENVALRGRVSELEGMVAERDGRILHLEELVAALQE